MVIKNCGKAVVAALTAIVVTTLFAGNDANPDAIELVPLPQPAKFCYFKVGQTYFEVVQRQFGVKKGILRKRDPAGTDPTCCAGNFKWTGCDFERYGFFGISWGHTLRKIGIS